MLKFQTPEQQIPIHPKQSLKRLMLFNWVRVCLSTHYVNLII